MAGIHVTYDMTMPPQKRVKDVKIRCQDCDIPVFEDLIMDQAHGSKYTVVKKKHDKESHFQSI